MLSTGEIVRAALLHGLWLSLALGAVIVATLRWNAESWLGDYPPDIREAFGPQSARARRDRIVGGIVFLAVLVTGLGLGLGWLFRADGSPGFWDIFLYVFVFATTFNAFDLLVVDWLWLIRFQPRFIVLPGTEGMAGYRDYAFHFRAFLVGVVGTIVLALGAAGLAQGLRAL